MGDGDRGNELDDDQAKTADELDRAGEDPAAESGAGYGSHAPEQEEREQE